MPKFQVFFKGWYIIEEDTMDAAIGTSMEDFGVEYAEYENYHAWELEEGYDAVD